MSAAADRRLAALRSITAVQGSRQRRTILSLAGLALIILSALLGPDLVALISGIAR